MSRKGTKDQNDISLIIGSLPKRLQNKFAASCSHNSHAAEDAENAEPARPASTRPVKMLSKPNANAGKTPNISASVLDTHGCISLEKRSTDVGIPGILRVNATPPIISSSSADNLRVVHRTRRRNRTHSARMHDQTPLSPLSRVRLNTDHPVWFEQLLTMPSVKIIVQLYDQLMVLQQRNLILINWKNFCVLHGQLQEAFCCLLLEQLKFVCEHKVDTFFWKMLFYNIREYLKQQQSDIAQNHTLLLIEQTLKFYRALFDKLMTKYISARCESAVKVVAQRMLICLGDLSRYRATHLQVSDFMEACKYYQRAQELIPGNGAPYNQLAIVAIYNHKRFDAVYYYMRSLLSSNAIESAKESLLDLFDEIRRKYEETEMKQSPMHCSTMKNATNSKQMRKEVWIYPDGIRRLHRTDDKTKNQLNQKPIKSDLNRYDEMPAEDLLPRVVSLYLYLVGKLFTATDIECMYQQLGKLQIQLGSALKYDHLMTRTKLLKIVAINVFVLEHNKLKANRREMRYHSFNFANAMFGLVLSRANHLLASLSEDSTDIQGFTDEELMRINTYMQFINVYTHWLTINVSLWEPVRTEDHSFIDCWAELQILFDHLEIIYNKLDKDADSFIVLDEDIVLSGFEPLGRDGASREGGHRSSERAQFVERVRRIFQFQEVYIQNQELLQQPLNSSFTIEDLNTAMEAVLNNFNVEECATSMSSECGTSLQSANEVDSNSLVVADADVSQLCKLKKELEAKARAKKMYNNKLEQILKLVDTKLYIEVRPRCLLPDTNCFIDCLEDIEKLAMEFKRYTIIIPLTVVKELDGLSRGSRPLGSYRNSKRAQRILHLDEVSSRAKKSLEFIKSAKQNVKCATIKGSVINASLFSLVDEEYASNDDKILATAVALSKTASTQQCRDGKCFIQTELVLITTDRNLRVKALARNLAVSALDEFLQWAKDCRESS